MSNLLSSDDETEVKAWELPEVGSSADYHGPLTAGQIEQLQKQAYEEGFARGHQDGLNAGEQEAQRQLQYLGSILDLFDAPLKELDDTIVQQLVDLTTIIAGQVIRRELRADPGQIIAVVRECIKNLPVAARKISIFLHPDDAMLVRGAFSIDDNVDQSWQIIDDPVLTRGGCRIEAENSKIDATVEQQLNRVIANLLGGEREQDEN
jgi:flagellar assembly protein FliH